MAFVSCSGDEADPKESAKMMREMMGPQAVDQQIRQAISCCWMMLPEEKRTVETIGREIRKLVDRALKDLKEDMTTFGIPAPKSKKSRGGRQPRAPRYSS